MHRLIHFRLCPLSRSVRAAMAELALEAEAVEEQPWDLKHSFLAVNPAGELPVLQITRGPVLCGVYAISEYLAEEVKSHPRDGRPAPLFPGSREVRAEVRRLVDWFNGKLYREVTRELLYEKVYGRKTPASGHTPDREVLRAINANLRYHLSYIGYLADQRRWLAGDEMSFADLAAAAHLSTIDYFGDIPWAEHPAAKAWYAKLKSRPSFRGILADRMPGLSPPAAYANLDF
ncbi:MAG: glutathione S-transferase family protein [Hyphomicrobium sp.]